MSAGKETVDRIKRVKRANYHQTRYGRCVICGGRFKECGHTMQEAQTVIDAVKNLEALGEDRTR